MADGKTDGWTDGRMERSVLRAARSQLKNEITKEEILNVLHTMSK